MRPRSVPARSVFNLAVLQIFALYLLVVAMIPMIQGTEVLITPGLIAALAVGAVGSTWPLWRAMVEYAVHRVGVWFPLAVAIVVVAGMIVLTGVWDRPILARLTPPLLVVFANAIVLVSVIRVVRRRGLLRRPG